MKRVLMIAVPVAVLLMALLALLFPRTEAGGYVNAVVVISLLLAAAGDFVWRRWRGRSKDEQKDRGE